MEIAKLEMILLVTLCFLLWFISEEKRKAQIINLVETGEGGGVRVQSSRILYSCQSPILKGNPI